MQSKMAIQFKKSIFTSLAHQRLLVCRNCRSITSLIDASSCAICSKELSLHSLTDYMSILNKPRGQAEVLFIGCFVLLSIIAATDLLQLLISIGMGIVSLVVILLIRAKYRTELMLMQLQKILLKKQNLIDRGLENDFQRALEEIKIGHYKQAYEILREIGYFKHNDTIRNYKIDCLNRFVLRTDMELELDSLVPSEYNLQFIIYLYEVSKVNKQLIRRPTLDYVMEHREAIEALAFGPELIANICSATLRMRSYVDLYQLLIIDYMDKLPRERFLRLVKMIAANTEYDWTEITSRASQIVHSKYDYDPEFKGII